MVEEKRLFARFSAWFPAKIKDSREQFGEKIYLQDASAGGVHVRTKHDFTRHNRLTMEIALPDGQGAMPLTGEVVWSKKTPSPSAWGEVGIRVERVDLMGMARLYRCAVSPENGKWCWNR